MVTLANSEAQQKADQEALDNEVMGTQAKLQEAFGLKAKMTAKEYAEAISAIEERKYAEIESVREATDAVGKIYKKAVEKHGADSPQAQRSLKLLTHAVQDAITDVNEDEALLQALQQKPGFENFKPNGADAEKVAMLVAADIDDKVMLAKGKALHDKKKGKPGAEEEAVSGGDDVALNDDIGAPAGLPPIPAGGPKRGGRVAA